METIRNMLSERAIDGLVVNSPKNRRYLSGFTGSAGTVLITKDRALFFTDFRYKSQAAAQCKGYEILLTDRENKVQDLIGDMGLATLWFEDAHMTVKTHQEWRAALGDTVLLPMGETVETLRQIKTEDEIAAIRTAASIADKAFDHILSVIKPGVTEREVALALEVAMKNRGATALAFESIVASGWRGALPHGIASDKVIEKGDLVTLDFGCVYDGYCSDMTRTVAVGPISPEQKKIYDTVRAAQEAALEAIQPGATGESVDKVARAIIEEAGYGAFFGHGLGHAVGLDVHESPRLAPGVTETLKPGMVVTNEPGIYIPDLGGVRIEDLCVVAASGPVILSKSTKELITL